jgi:hypothetical protein
MFGGKGKHKYESDIIVGDLYRDKKTNVEGHATAITFFENSCERVSLMVKLPSGEIKDYGFDAADLIHVESEKEATVDKPGGPEKGVSHVRPTGALR